MPLSKKNKSISKGKTGGKKKTVDPFAKDWYDIKAPSVFSVRNIGKTLVSRTQGTKIASEGFQHRVFEVCLADLQNDEDQAHRKIRLRAEDVQGKNGQSKMTAFNIFCVKVDRPAEDVQMEGEEVAGALAYRWVWRTVLGT